MEIEALRHSAAKDARLEPTERLRGSDSAGTTPNARKLLPSLSSRSICRSRLSARVHLATTRAAIGDGVVTALGSQHAAPPNVNCRASPQDRFEGEPVDKALVRISGSICCFGPSPHRIRLALPACPQRVARGCRCFLAVCSMVTCGASAKNRRYY
jgi:hypothetical protein